ncbi:MAG: MBL fold metallo-hydrolase [Acidilobus sp.]
MDSINKLRVGVLVDEKPRAGLRGEYGLSLYIESERWRLLFDAGSSDATLGSNASAMGVDLSTVDLAIISHEHFDHTGGLAALARSGTRAPVLIPAGASWRLERAIEDLGLSAKRVVTGSEVLPGAFLLSQQYGPPYEQALAINLKGRGLVTVHGCSHPGPSKIVAKALNDTGVRPFAVIGGLHLAWSPPEGVRSELEALASLGVKVLVPLHCSGSLVMRESSSFGIESREVLTGDWVEF